MTAPTLAVDPDDRCPRQLSRPDRHRLGRRLGRHGADLSDREVGPQVGRRWPTTSRRGRLLRRRLHAQDPEEGRQDDQEDVRGRQQGGPRRTACSPASSWTTTSTSGRCGGRTCASTGRTRAWSRSRSASRSTRRPSSTASSRCRWPGSTTSASSTFLEEFLWEVPLRTRACPFAIAHGGGAVLALGQDVPDRQPAGRRHRHQAEPSRAGHLDHGLAQPRRPRVPRHPADASQRFSRS